VFHEHVAGGDIGPVSDAWSILFRPVSDVSGVIQAQSSPALDIFATHEIPVVSFNPEISPVSGKD
jgi:hypothetical protein